MKNPFQDCVQKIKVKKYIGLFIVKVRLPIRGRRQFFIARCLFYFTVMFSDLTKTLHSRLPHTIIFVTRRSSRDESR